MHNLQDLVAAALEWDMKMRSKMAALRHKIDDVVAEEIGLAGRDAVSHFTTNIVQCADQVRECLTCGLAEIAYVDAG